jgi:hypothetical protein
MFIGSSKEGLPVAEAIQLNLDHDCEVTIWSQGVFGLSEGTLETLVEKLCVFDFAALVLTPDDVVDSQGHVGPAPRDNVLLELGMFIGALGRERTFIVYDRQARLKLPSDLAGVTSATYQKHMTGNLQSSVGAASTLIKRSIDKLGKKPRKINADIDQNTTFQIIHDLLENAPEQFIIWMHENNQTMIRQRRSLLGGIKYQYVMNNTACGSGGFSMDELCKDLADASLLEINLRDQVTLTRRGHEFAEWLVRNGHKAMYFESAVGGWGTLPSAATDRIGGAPQDHDGNIQRSNVPIAEKPSAPLGH